MTSEIENLLSFDHSELDRLLEQTFSSLESGDAAVAFQKLDLFWARLAMHIRGEHLHLFPALLQAAQESQFNDHDSSRMLAEVPELLTELHNDHDFFMRELVTAIKLMRVVQNGEPAETDKCLSECRELLEPVRERLITHNRIEEEKVYSMVADQFDSIAQNDLLTKVTKELTNLPPRHRKSKAQ